MPLRPIPAFRASAPVGVGLVAALATLLAITSPAAAVTGQDLTALATGTYGMTCAGSGANESCTKHIVSGRLIGDWIATISPATGTLTGLVTDARINSQTVDTVSEPWMSAMHGTACGDAAAAEAFAASVWALTAPETAGPASIGNCTTSGDASVDPVNGQTHWRMTSIVHPAPTPTPTHSPTHSPTPKPSPKPTAAPNPSPTASASPSPSPSPSPSASPSPSPAATAPASYSPLPLPTTSPGAAAVGPSLPASPAPGLPGVPPGSGHGPTFAGSVEALTDIDLDADTVAGSALLALVLLLLMGFPAELFNDTVEANREVIAGWARRWHLGRPAGVTATHPRLTIAVYVLLTALVSALVDPHFGFDLESAAELAGFLVALGVVLLSFKLPPMLAHRRRTGELGRLTPLPWALAVAVLFVIVSRAADLRPGYLYGIVLGVLYSAEVPPREEGRETLLGSLWTLAAAVAAGLGLAGIRLLDLPADDLLGIAGETALAAILVLGMEATAFGLLPLRFLPGYAVYRFNRLAWAVTFGVSVFAFAQLLLGPDAGYLSHLTPEAFLAALGVFAGFGALSLGTWAYFRFRRPTAAVAAAEEGLG